MGLRQKWSADDLHAGVRPRSGAYSTGNSQIRSLTQAETLDPFHARLGLDYDRYTAGTVMLEGTTLSEGRGTTRPLELFGAGDINARDVMAEMERLEKNFPPGLDWLHAGGRALALADFRGRVLLLDFWTYG